MSQDRLAPSDAADAATEPAGVYPEAPTKGVPRPKPTGAPYAGVPPCTGVGLPEAVGSKSDPVGVGYIAAAGLGA